MAEETKEEEFNESTALLRSRLADYGDESAIELNKKLIAKCVMDAMEIRPSAETQRIGQMLLRSQGSSEDVRAALELRSGRSWNDLTVNSNAMCSAVQEETAPTEEMPAAAPKTWIQ